MKKRHKCRKKCFFAMIAVFLAVAGWTPGFFGRMDVCAATGQENNDKPVEISDSEIYAQCAVLMDAASGRILYSKQGDEYRANASTTKILTCIVTLENADLNDLVTVSGYAASMPDVQLNIKEGEQYLLRDLLYSLMLESHNDSAVAIAEHVAGSVEQFAVMMNDKAKEIGCTNSFFVTPNGLDKTALYTAEDGTTQEKSHGTTAADLARIMSYCVLRSPARDMFLEITRTPSYSFCNKELSEEHQVKDGTRQFSCTNHNAYLSMDPEALSGKTGFTSAAGYCYVGAVQSQGRTFAVALLACGWPNNKTYKWQDCDRLFSYAKDYYHYRPLDALGITFEQVEIEDAANDTFDLKKKSYCIPQADLSMEILLADWETLDARIRYPRAVPAPLSGEKKIGTVDISIDGNFFVSSDVIINDHMEEKNLRWIFSAVCRKWMMWEAF